MESIFNSIIGARAPERFTNRFLEDLGYKSSSDRLIIGILKSLGLIDENGVPKQRYYDFLDQSQSKSIIATGIQEAYTDLFNIKGDIDGGYTLFLYNEGRINKSSTRKNANSKQTFGI